MDRVSSLSSISAMEGIEDLQAEACPWRPTLFLAASAPFRPNFPCSCADRLRSRHPLWRRLANGRVAFQKDEAVERVSCRGCEHRCPVRYEAIV